MNQTRDARAVRRRGSISTACCSPAATRCSTAAAPTSCLWRSARCRGDRGGCLQHRRAHRPRRARDLRLRARVARAVARARALEQSARATGSAWRRRPAVPDPTPGGDVRARGRALAGRDRRRRGAVRRDPSGGSSGRSFDASVQRRTLGAWPVPPAASRIRPGSSSAAAAQARLRPRGLARAAASRIRPASGSAVSARALYSRPGRSPPARDPRDYTPKHLADKILHSQSALEGERKQVTVLFADVKGSMELAEQVDPEEWHGILDRFFADPDRRRAPLRGHRQPVHRRRHHGALRRADRARGPRAARLLRGARTARGAARATRDELQREHGLDFAVRMGINSGEVVVGKIGDDLRMDYTAQGHTVGLAARMEQLAEPGSIYVERAHGGVGPGLLRAATTSGEFEVKGAAEPVRVFELQGAGRAAHALRRVARARALALRRARGGAARARGRARATRGGRRAGGRRGGRRGRRQEPALLRVRSSAAAPAACASTRRAPSRTGSNIPFLPILELLRAYFGISASDDDRERAREDRRARAAARRELREALPLLFDFLGVADPERPGAAARARGAPAPADRRDAPGSCGRASAAQPTVTADRGPALDRRRERRVPRAHGRRACPARAPCCC